MKKYTYRFARLAVLILFITMALKSQAQLNPLNLMYYQNRYLLNPAFAGINKGLEINAAYQQQWNGIPGAPKTARLTGDYAATERVGLGLNISDDQLGVLRTTRIVGSYAYHIRLNDADDQHLHFGLSLGVNDSRVDRNKVSGDLSDIQISQYNQLKPYLDGDFGIAYTDKYLMISGTLPNLNTTILKTSDNRFSANQLLFVGAVAYKFNIPSDYNITLEPLVAYRVVKGFNNIFEGGVNLAFNYGINFQAIYHSNQNMSTGVGLELNRTKFLFNYNFETGSLSNYTNGGLELGMRFHAF